MPYTECQMPQYPLQSDMWDELSRQTKPIVVYGMGNGADKLLKRFEKYGITVSDFFASDGFVRGHTFHGMRVKSFTEIKETYEDFVIVLSFASNRREVLEMLVAIDGEYDMYVPDMPVAGEEYFDRDFFNANYSEIMRAYGALADSDSRNAFSSIINYKLTGRMSYLMGAYSPCEEIYALLPRESIKRIVDAGAYNGDTVREAREYFPNLSSVYAVEPDPKNYKKLTRFAEGIEDLEIHTVNAAVWSDGGEGVFSSGGNRNSSINSTSSYKHSDTGVALVTVDSLDFPADYLKYDVEGAEYEALLGSENTIRSAHPSLLVSLYHRSRDIFFLVNYLKDKYPEYQAYIRRRKCVPAWEIDLIMLYGT